MERAEADRVIADNLNTLVELMALESWRVQAGCDRIANNPEDPPEWEQAAKIETMAAYSRARITLDPERSPTPEALLGHLRHELHHLQLSAFDQYRSLVLSFLPKGRQAREVERRAWSFALETAVWQLERAWAAQHRPEEGEK